MKKVSPWAVATLLIALPIFTQGCLLVPFVDAFKQSGMAEGDRMAQLPGEVRKFTDSLSRADKTEAMLLVVDTSRSTILKQLKGLGEDDHIVESKVDEVEWLDNSYKARVEVKVRHYKVPYYVVKTRLEEQVWVFSVATGWKLKERTVHEE